MAARPGDRERPQPKRKDAPAPKRSRARQDEGPPGYEDPVDETSADSMIASDPPARSGVRLGPARRKRRG